MSHSQPPAGPYGQNPPGSAPPLPPFPPPVPPAPPIPPQVGSSKRKKAGIAIGALIVVGAVVGGFALFGEDGEASDTVVDDGKRYKLTAPDTVLSEYESWGDAPQEHTMAEGETALLGIGDGKRISNEWSTVDMSDPDSDFDNAKSIVFTGFYGSVDDPDKSVDAFFDVMRRSAVLSQPVGDKEKQSPKGFKNGIMKCQYQKSDAEPGQPDTTPLCIWADHSTVASVVVVDATQDKLSLEKGAEIAAGLREEIRVEIK
ncbi:hypothetical protein [Streptomyces sparsogenes]|uniref:Uncharacterized protein n=1 Tax=Streptomyces sparsogenes DSM 40356 TaxID=1331668 RepID=A0A1R1SRM4_9ACTN|nr:hypothetical protein [Streptomyces sparsogenes]OMI40956.1 hypothetical protein SPAR_03246 [Streptomyces sparsogenes DSM 40356]